MSRAPTLEPPKDPVMLESTVVHTGEVKITGPWDREMLKGWLENKERECAEGIVTWEIKEIS